MMSDLSNGKMYRYDVYGFQGLTLDSAKELVSLQIGVALELHDSSYWGGYYCLQDNGVRRLMLYENNVGEWSIDKYSRFSIVLLVNELSDLEMDRYQHVLCRAKDSTVFLLQSKRVIDLE